MIDPRLNVRFGLQYTLYTRFNGASSNYDGTGSSASDNNTLRAFVWFAMTEAWQGTWHVQNHGKFCFRHLFAAAILSLAASVRAAEVDVDQTQPHLQSRRGHDQRWAIPSASPTATASPTMSPS